MDVWCSANKNYLLHLNTVTPKIIQKSITKIYIFMILYVIVLGKVQFVTDQSIQAWLKGKILGIFPLWVTPMKTTPTSFAHILESAVSAMSRAITGDVLT